MEERVGQGQPAFWAPYAVKEKQLESVNCPPMFSIPVFAWTLCNTINKMSRKMLAEQTKQAEGLLAISSHPGLCTLSRMALWAVLLTRSSKMLQTRKLFFLLFPAPVPATFFSPMVFLALIILVSIGGPIQIIILASQSGDSIRGGLSSQKFQGRAETSLMAQF